MNAAGNPAMMIASRYGRHARKAPSSVRPFARAVITYCLLISSKKEFLVSIVRVAKALIRMK